jgi:hypothetical protein
VTTVTAPLRLEELSTDGAWLPLEVDAEFAPAYAAVTGRSEGRPAAGWSIVVARLGLTRGGRPFPPGGVLLGITLTSLAAAPADGRWEYRTETAVAAHPSGRPTLTATVALRAADDGGSVAEVGFLLRWPEEQ